MSEIKRIKITSYMFEDEKIRLIDAMENGVMVIYVWLRLLVQAGKISANGYIYLTENIPYTEEMLSTLFCKSLESIKFALKTLCNFQMIEIDSNNIIKILNWDKHQNIEGMERVRAQNRKRAENHREKKKQIEETTKGNFENVKENCEGEKQNIDYVEVQDDEEENLKVNKEDNANYIENTDDSLSNNINDDSNSITNNSCGVINNLGSVTKNKSNVTVMQQNKRESKNKKENKNKTEIEIESEDNNIADEINNKGSTFDEEAKEVSLSQSEKLKEDKAAIADDLNAKAIEIMTYYEKITGVIGGINYGALRLAIDMHGAESVKIAINKALEVNQTDMRYINGILKNWRREVYSNQREESKNGTRSAGKSNSADKNEFTGFKPKKPRNLTESERKEAQEGLI
ncbi:hypothetical protein psyc5s11_22250 [Clostridium gelidum]|uniref:Phage replisome organiser N-terminal domain-containing protein n=1 Tax=Clostridium gelidum TaxID=704125 RepID=A0ABN6IXJ3_9CLOT|nr:hypothetical protein psyc5s11_22250 [Clostridium gelidum]